ncbi:hypothetical protein KSS87_022860 [Heliosperma pusillum]|nr:hypothetical protein KSS87_022860 [Heliosperma pusillum]
MCIAVFVWQSHPLYPLILLLNRDEYHSRPTKPAGWWEGGEILGGRDELGGGTWLACSKNGKVSFVTNSREKDRLPHAKTRGDLPVRFLQSEKGPTEYAEEIIQEADLYNGFNLLAADLHSKSMVYVTNRPKENKPSFLHVSSGTHVLTNASLDTLWPKAERLLGNFKEMMETYGESEVEAHEIVEKLMTDTTKNETLPGILNPEAEHQLSSIFVNTDTPNGRYGTRSTSAVLAKSSGEVCFHEQYLVADCWKEHTITYHT